MEGRQNEGPEITELGIRLFIFLMYIFEESKKEVKVYEAELMPSQPPVAGSYLLPQRD